MKLRVNVLQDTGNIEVNLLKFSYRISASFRFDKLIEICYLDGLDRPNYIYFDLPF